MSKNTTKQNKTSGTLEWCVKNINFQYGCKYNCKYCYAYNMAHRFSEKQPYRRGQNRETWGDPCLNMKAIEKNYLKKWNGWVMLSSTHDVYSENYKWFKIILRKLLECGNKVMIVTKPNIETITNIIKEFDGYKSNIQFRFTITGINKEILEYWEPNAPSFEERMNCLKYAFSQGFKTSVSIEPYLEDPTRLVMLITPYITETIWIGIMNKYPSITKEDYKKVKKLYQIKPTFLIGFYQGKLAEIYCNLQDHNLIRWKDSIRNIFKKMFKKPLEKIRLIPRENGYTLFQLCDQCSNLTLIPDIFPYQRSLCEKCSKNLTIDQAESKLTFPSFFKEDIIFLNGCYTVSKLNKNKSKNGKVINFS